MSRLIRQYVPSMFQRRLLLLLAVAFLVSAALSLQLFNLTVVQGSKLREEAEGALLSVSLVPTIRGQIFDRKMRVLAVDQTSDDVAVKYSVITGQWAYRRAREIVYRRERYRWAELAYDERERMIAETQKPFDAQVAALWQMLSEIGGISTEELEERRNTIIRRVQQIAASVSIRQRDRRIELLQEPVTLADVTRDVEEQRAAHSLLFGIDPRSIVRIQELIAGSSAPANEVWQEVVVEPSKQRAYPLETLTVTIDRTAMPTPLRSDEPLVLLVEGVGTHLLGNMRNIWRDMLDARPLRGASRVEGVPDMGGYLPGDKVGAWGLERSQETYLRGSRGRTIRRLDTGEENKTSPVPGGDIVTTIDIALQARVQAILDPRTGLMQVQPWNAKEPEHNPLRPQVGDAINGSAVVLDIATGEVLAAVSMPSLSLRQLDEDPDAVLKDEINQPYVNRAVGLPLQPGSTVKPLVLAAALSDRKVGPDESIACTGHFYPGLLNVARCWIYNQSNNTSTHQPLAGPEAIARSCNIYFFTMGNRLGPQRLVHWYHQFGIGRLADCGLVEEHRGVLPDIKRDGSGVAQQDAVYMGIGQGPMQWTCLQAAATYATLGRGGIYLAPTFIRSPAAAERRHEDLHLSRSAVELAMQGLDDAVNQRYGTGHHLGMLNNEPIINIEGVNVYAKSGTADTSPGLRVDTDNDGRITSADRVVRQGDHAWFVAIVRREGSSEPGYVVAVVAEFAGSGGAVSGPVLNQILHAMRKEGYL